MQDLYWKLSRSRRDLISPALTGQQPPTSVSLGARLQFADESGAHVGLKRDEIRLNRHRALGLCWSMIFSENRYTLFQIML